MTEYYDDEWLLMGTEYVRNKKSNKIIYDRMNLVFYGIHSGIVKRVERTGVLPYMYTTMDIDDVRNILNTSTFVRDDDGVMVSAMTLVSSLQEVEILHPITLDKVTAVKIIATAPYKLFSTYTDCIYDFLIPDTVFNYKDKYADYYIKNEGLVMGMTYLISKGNNVQILISPRSEEIENIVPKLEIPPYLHYALNDKLLDLFFSEFPDITPSIAAIDIEIDNDYKNAINVIEAKYPVSSVAYYSNREKIVYVLSDKVRGKNYKFEEPEDIEYKLVICDTEYELLDNVLGLIVTSPEKFIVGYNLDKFDLPYLCIRAETLGLRKWSNRIWGRWDERRETFIKGITNKFLVDLYPFFKNPSIKNYTFKSKYVRNSLEAVSSALLGEGKYKFDAKINELNARQLAFYNFIDTKRTFELCTYESNIVINLIIMFMRISGRTFEDVHRRQISNILKGLIDSVLYNAGIMQPNKIVLRRVGAVSSTSIIEGKGFQGAHVFDPVELNTVGWWQDNEYGITCTDFASLYPSEIKKENLCFSTINCGHAECMSNRVPGLPHYVCKNKKGIISSLIGFIRDIRVMYFKKHKKDSIIYSIVEQTLKVLINAGYGVLGYSEFAYYTAPLSESTTAFARNDITKVSEYCDNHNVKVLYGDTDSVFLYRASDEFLDDLFDYVENTLKLEMGIDYQGKYMLIYKKKHYIMDNEGKPMIKGMSGKKSNTYLFVRDLFTKCVKIIHKNSDSLSTIKIKLDVIINQTLNDLYNNKIPVTSMVKTIKLGNPLSSYASNPQHVKAAKKLVLFIRDKIGDKSLPDDLIVPQGMYIDYIIGEGKEPIPIEIVLDEKSSIDIQSYQKTIVSTLSQILLPLGIDVEYYYRDVNQTSLNEFF